MGVVRGQLALVGQREAMSDPQPYSRLGKADSITRVRSCDSKRPGGIGGRDFLRIKPLEIYKKVFGVKIGNLIGKGKVVSDVSQTKTIEFVVN